MQISLLWFLLLQENSSLMQEFAQAEFHHFNFINANISKNQKNILAINV